MRDTRQQLNIIIREPSFDTAISDIAETHHRMGEIDSAIDWGLARCPTAFHNFKEDFYLWKMEQIGDGFPQILIVYRYVEAESTVYLIEAFDVSDIKH